jgi:hypothetical protein
MLKSFLNYFIFGNIKLCCEEKVKHLVIGSFSKWESLILPSINLFNKLVLNLSLVMHVIITNKLPW